MYKNSGKTVKVLAETRGKGSADNHGKRCVVCGYLDWNETAEEAVAREAFEETGFKVKQTRLNLIRVMTDPKRDARQNVCLIYTYEAARNEKFNVTAAKGGEKDEVSNVEWVEVARKNNGRWSPVKKNLTHDSWAFNHDSYIAAYIDSLNEVHDEPRELEDIQV